MVNWSEHAKHTLPFNCSNTTQDKKKASKTPIDDVYCKAPIVRRAGAHMHINNW